uniref:Uncharacterized protein n=1 Tax=Bursaphelenchus xylophilus TaxID=6326 RepID=A0A1I7S6R7_BURXY
MGNKPSLQEQCQQKPNPNAFLPNNHRISPNPANPLPTPESTGRFDQTLPKLQLASIASDEARRIVAEAGDAENWPIRCGKDDRKRQSCSCKKGQT